MGIQKKKNQDKALRYFNLLSEFCSNFPWLYTLCFPIVFKSIQKLTQKYLHITLKPDYTWFSGTCIYVSAELRILAPYPRLNRSYILCLLILKMLHLL